MNIQVDAIYENGVLRLQAPLDLPNSTAVRVTVAARPQADDDDVDKTPLPRKRRLTVEEFRQIMDRVTFGAGTLSPDFDRDDIYSDHD